MLVRNGAFAYRPILGLSLRLRTSWNPLRPKFREHSADCEVRPKRMNAAPGRSYRARGEEEISSSGGYYREFRETPTREGLQEQMPEANGVARMLM